MNDPRRQLSLAFESLVSDRLSFLKHGYGYVQQQTRLPDFELSHGDECAISFGSARYHLGVDAFLDFETYIVDVALFESPCGSFREYSVWGQVHLSQAVLLSALIACRTGRPFTSSILPPSLPSLSRRERQRRFDRRKRAIHQDLPAVVEEAAGHLAEFGTTILRGDTSLFPEIQSFYRELQGATLSRDGKYVQFVL